MSTPVPHLTWEKIGVLNGKRMTFRDERNAVYKAILARRDIRMYRPIHPNGDLTQYSPRWSCGWIGWNDTTVELYCLGRRRQTNTGASPFRRMQTSVPRLFGKTKDTFTMVHSNYKVSWTPHSTSSSPVITRVVESKYLDATPFPKPMCTAPVLQCKTCG